MKHFIYFFPVLPVDQLLCTSRRGKCCIHAAIVTAGCCGRRGCERNRARERERLLCFFEGDDHYCEVTETLECRGWEGMLAKFVMMLMMMM
jgi:hypothetical protein